MMHIILAGKAKDVFKELEKMARLERTTGHVLVRYSPDISKIRRH